MTVVEAPHVSTLERDVAAEVDRLFRLQQQHRPLMSATTARERIQRLKKLERILFERRAQIQKAIHDDFRKPAAEVDLSEIYLVAGEIRHTARHLGRWMKPKRVSTPLALLGTRSEIRYEPKGVVLIIAPFNFPLSLALGPLVSAVAAGNCAVVKPSEMMPNTSRCIRELIEAAFDEREVAVVEGDVKVSEILLRKKWDHIFFTGSPTVGKIIMHAAAEHLTPVTLELGGKSPVIVDETADLDDAAKKVAWGKLLNNGQACVAPDYLFVHESVRDAFVEKLQKSIIDLYGQEIHTNEDYGRIVNERHHLRLHSLIDRSVAKGATAHRSGKGTAEDRFVSPTILTDVPPDAPVMTEEIFGPVLPVLDFKSLDEPLRFIAERDKPLAMYVFSRNSRNIEKILRETTAGGTCVNDTMLHFFHPNLPFGGVGNSGIGKGHGFFGFEAFSNARGVLYQSRRFALTRLLYPPFTPFVRKVIDLTIKWF